MTKVIGLTGSIASGKSTVSEFLKAQHIPLLDADVIAREVVEKESEGLQKLVLAFGKEILQADGTLNRKKLGQLIFNQEEKRKTLNQILHPLIREAMLRKRDEAKAQNIPLLVMDIPLLFETNYADEVDEIVVVAVSPTVQLQRLMDRNQLSQAEATARIATQWPITQKMVLADVVIDNNGTKEETREQVEAWLKKLS
ncbi:dephospho-CoA kinase [Isobaculum melis]|uniref:Dephospho-CoA kinase n=1 Tax=Isobaculum melis TaxID=142588 RepID=A0A1H9S995_9LACT|nr:dephospho-CoA kinase [Isobaculum melis]SER81165.1 dephospho-CoA kinase [Isobaculum melis]